MAAHAQDAAEASLFPILEGPVQKPVIQLAQPPSGEWQISPLETFGLQWIVRAKEALSWSLGLKDGGTLSPAIEAAHAKVLTLVNSLFILGLLAIAGMWSFSLFIPRGELKKAMLGFGAAVIFVNFALPANQLLIEGADLVQRTMLVEPDGKVAIADLIQTPDYGKAIAYRKKNEDLSQGRTIRHELKVLPSAQTDTGEVTLATLHSQEKTLLGSLAQGGSLGQLEFNIPENSSQSLRLNTSQGLAFEQTTQNSAWTEAEAFAFLALMGTGLAYFLMALVLVLRTVMLWALLILSPALLLMGIFQSTRGWFTQWIAVYGRWLLIGPLVALGLSLVVSIWKLTGIPANAQALGEQVFAAETLSNIAFYLPGRNAPNTLSSTSQMMEYMLFVAMLYMPLFFAFTLTRKKTVHAVGSLIQAYSKTLKKSGPLVVGAPASAPEPESRRQEGRPNPGAGMAQSVHGRLMETLDRLAQKAMPFQQEAHRPAERGSSKESLTLKPSPAPIAQNSALENGKRAGFGETPSQKDSQRAAYNPSVPQANLQSGKTEPGDKAKNSAFDAFTPADRQPAGPGLAEPRVRREEPFRPLEERTSEPASPGNPIVGPASVRSEKESQKTREFFMPPAQANTSPATAQQQGATGQAMPLSAAPAPGKKKKRRRKKPRTPGENQNSPSKETDEESSSEFPKRKEGKEGEGLNNN